MRVGSKWTLYPSKPIGYLVIYHVTCSNRHERDEPFNVRVTPSRDKRGDAKWPGPGCFHIWKLRTHLCNIWKCRFILLLTMEKPSDPCFLDFHKVNDVINLVT